MSTDSVDCSIRTAPELTNSTVAHEEVASEAVRGAIAEAVDERDHSRADPRNQLYASEEARAMHKLRMHYVLQLEERERGEERAAALARTRQLLLGIIQK